MKLLVLIGGIAVIAVLAIGVWYLTNNLTLKKGRK